MSEENCETTTGESLSISPLRLEEEMSENQYISASLSYKNSAGDPYSILRVKESLPSPTAEEREWVDTNYKTVAAEVEGETFTTKTEVSSVVRSCDKADFHFKQVDTVEEQPLPGKPKQELPLYKLILHWSDEGGKHPIPDEE